MIPLSDLEVVDTQDLLKDMFSYLKTVPSFAFDFETRSVDFNKFPNGALDRTRMLPDLFSASTDTRAFVVPIGMLTVPVVSLQDFVDISKPVMEDPSILHDGWNWSYDAHVFANQDVWVAGYRDWMVAAALLDDNRAKSLKERCKDVGMELHKYDFKKYWTMRDKILNPDRVFYTATGRVKKEVVYTLADIEPLEQEYISYSAEDSIATYFLGELYTDLLEKEGLSNLFFRLRNPAVRTAFMMERRGIRIDVAGLAQRKKLAEIDLVKYEKDILSIAGKHFNIGSTKEVGKVLYDEMRLPVKKKTPKGAPSSDAETLGLLGQDGHEIAIALSKHRKVAKIMSSYLGPKSKFSSNVKPWEYIHPSFNTVGTKTGRWSSSDPNFMQLPRNTEANYTLREVIIPSAGKVLCGGDLSQAELRVMADLSQDPVMLEEYRKDAAFQQCIIDGNDPKELGLELSDIHQTTADACGCTRNVAKTINFGLIYRMAGSTLARSLNKALWDFKFSEGDYTWDPLNDTIDERLGNEFKEMYFIKYAGVKAYHRLIEQRLQDYGYIETRFGQKRRLPDIYANDNFLRWRAGTQGINSCLDEKTEALTDTGWKNYKDLVAGKDKLLTKNPNTGALEWETLKSVFINEEYTGERIHLKSATFDSVSTHDHRWLVDTKRGRKSVCKRTSELSNWGDDKIHLTGDSYVGPDEDEYCDDFIALAGWFLTDGYSSPKVNTVSFSQSQRANPKKSAEIQDLMTRYLKFDGGSFVEWSQCNVWKVRRPQTDLLRSLFPQRKLTMTFLLSLTEEHLDLLYRTMLKGDGSKRVCGGDASICCRDVAEANMFQVLCTLKGKSSRVQVIDTPTGGYAITHIMARTRAQTTKSMKTSTTGDKWTIWCPEIPNSYFVARRSGKTFVTGNSIQGHVGELMTLCMNRVHNDKVLRECGFRLILQVHDEILGECDPDCVDIVKQRLAQIFMRPMEPTKDRKYHGYRVPIIFEVQNSDLNGNWADIH